MNLVAAEQLGCGDDIFLAPILRAHEADGLSIGPETQMAVRGLKHGIGQLRNSIDPHIQGQITAVNKGYFQDDGMWYDADVFTDWKPGRNLLGNLLRANTAQIVRFAGLYNERVGELQQALNDDHHKLADDAMKRTDMLIGKNMLPKSAENLMEQTIVWAGEFEAIGSVEQAVNSNVGYCHDGGIGIANLYDLPCFPSNPSLFMHQTIFHEYLHGVGYQQSNKRGLFFGLTSRQYSNYNRWLEEAYVATVAHEAVKPDLKLALVKPKQPYSQERRFMKLVLDIAMSPVDLADLSAAHFSYRSSRTNVRRHVAQALGAGLNSVFPEYEGYAWEQINHNYEAQSHRQDRSKYIGRLLTTAQKRLSAESLADKVA